VCDRTINSDYYPKKNVFISIRKTYESIGILKDMQIKLPPIDGYCVENQGDRNYGTLLWLRQAHAIPDYIVDSFPGAREGRTYRIHRKRVLRSQRGILLELDRLGVLDIFHEREVETASPNSATRKLLSRDTWLDIQDDSVQAHILYEFGAATIYAGINPQVTVHRTNERNEDQQIGQLVRSEFERTGNIPGGLQMEQHELAAVRELDQFFLARNGAMAVLVFGGYHNFGDGWSSGSPMIYSKRFDGD